MLCLRVVIGFQIISANLLAETPILRSSDMQAR